MTDDLHARLAAAEAKLRAVDAVIADLDRRTRITSARYVRAQHIANALRHALQDPA